MLFFLIIWIWMPFRLKNVAFLRRNYLKMISVSVISANPFFFGFTSKKEKKKKWILHLLFICVFGFLKRISIAAHTYECGYYLISSRMKSSIQDFEWRIIYRLFSPFDRNFLLWKLIYNNCLPWKENVFLVFFSSLLFSLVNYLLF